MHEHTPAGSRCTQVITRSSGLQLGVVSGFLVHPRSAAVLFLALREKGLGGAETGGIIPLAALFQVRARLLLLLLLLLAPRKGLSNPHRRFPCMLWMMQEACMQNGHMKVQHAG